MADEPYGLHRRWRDKTAGIRRGLFAAVSGERVWQGAGMACLALLLSRVVLLESFAPIGPALLCAAMALGVYPAACLAGCLAGSLTLIGTAAASALPTIAVLGALGMWLLWKKGKPKGAALLWTMGGTCAAVEMLARLPTPDGWLIAVAQVFAASLLYPILHLALRVLAGKRSGTAGRLREEESICLAVLSGLVLLGISSIYFAWFWPAGALAVWLTLIFARVGGAGVGAGCGLAIGISLSLATAPDAVLICGVAGVGFLAGCLRGKNPSAQGANWGCALGSLAAGGLLLAYTGMQVSTGLAFADVLLGTVLFLPTPGAWLARLGKNIDGALRREWNETYYLEVLQSGVRKQTDALAETLRTLGDAAGRDAPQGRALCVAAKEIEQIGEEVKLRVRLERSLEREIADALQKEVQVRETTAWRDAWGALRVRVALLPDANRPVAESWLERRVSDVCATPMRIAAMRFPGKGEGQCVAVLEQSIALRVEVGMRVRPRAGQAVSGDTVSGVSWDEAHHTLCLCDGMGSGKAAHAHSQTTRRALLCALGAAGKSPPDNALRRVNRLLHLVRDREMFSAVDLCQLDLLEGKASFVKAGAAAGYLLRDKEAQSLRAACLPVGMLEALDCQATSMEIREGDVIVLMSDGVADALGDGLGEVMAGVSAARLEAGRIADTLVQLAVRRQNKSPRGTSTKQDDMSVIAARLIRA